MFGHDLGVYNYLFGIRLECRVQCFLETYCFSRIDMIMRTTQNPWENTAIKRLFKFLFTHNNGTPRTTQGLVRCGGDYVKNGNGVFQLLSGNQTATITVAAADPNFDVLQFTWKAADGELRGEGASVTWAPPEKAGTYTITLLVSDGKGGTVSGVVDILVEEKISDNLPPVIQSIKATPDVIRGNEKCLILVEASDPDGDELIYSWSNTRGEMVGDENEVTWVAPPPVGGC